MIWFRALGRQGVVVLWCQGVTVLRCYGVLLLWIWRCQGG